MLNYIEAVQQCIAQKWTFVPFSGLNNTEVGLFFGNDENCCGSTGFFDVVLEGFTGATSIGSVTVATNGNDLADQFIGFGSSIAFDRVVLTYGPGSGDLSHFINEIQFANGDVTPVPLPATALMLLAGLGGLGFAGRRRKAVV